jgi:hypothetical protein
MSFELEIRPAWVVRRNAYKKWRGRTAGPGVCCSLFPKDVKASRNENKTGTGAASKKASLKTALSGSKNWVHLKLLVTSIEFSSFLVFRVTTLDCCNVLGLA